MHPRRPPRGFTLVELMMVVGVIGILSSVAIPELGKATLRARSAERRSIMVAIAHVMSDVVLTQSGIPGHVYSAAKNPPLPLSTQKRAFDRSMAGWSTLPLAIEGNTYYSYEFVANDHFGAVPAARATLDVIATGDLDGDGLASVKTVSYDGFGNAFAQRSETPEAGAEDAATF